MPPKKKKTRRGYARPNKKSTKQKLIQKVNVNVNSSGGSGGGGSSQPYHAPPAFFDRLGENVILQKLTDNVNAFTAKAQKNQTLEPTMPVPSDYNDSPVDDIEARNKLIREMRLGNPILNPRPNNISQPLMAQVSDAIETKASEPPISDGPATPQRITPPETPYVNEFEDVEPTSGERRAQRKQDKMGWIENERSVLIKKLTDLQFLNAINEDEFVRIGSANYKTKKSITDAIKKVSNRLITAQLKNQNLSPIYDENTRLVI